MSELQLEEITRREGLREICGEWAELCARSPEMTPFQSPAWLIPYADIFGGEQLRIYLVRKAGRLVAIFPFYLLREAGQRKLLLLGTALSDYLDAIFDLEVFWPAAELVFEALERERAHWDYLEFQQLPAGAGLLECSIPSGWREERSEAMSCPVLELPTGACALEQVVPRSMVENLRYNRRRAIRDWGGPLSMVPASDANFDQLFDQLMEFHQGRQFARGEDGAFSSPQARTFHRVAARGLAQLGLLRMFGLRLAGKTLGVYLGTLQHGRAFFYASGFDPHFALLSPGTLLVGQAIEQALAEHACEFHFLRGEEPYKFRWGAVSRRTFQRRLQ